MQCILFNSAKKSAAKKIVEILKRYLMEVTLKKNLFMLVINIKREFAIIKIQKYVLRYLIQLEISNFRDRKRIFFEIPFSAEINQYYKNNKNIYLEILFPKEEQNKYFLQFCKFRKAYVAYLPKNRFNKYCQKKIYFKFNDNGQDCIDSNYEIFSEDKRKIFCNILDLKSYEDIEKTNIFHIRKKFYEYSKWIEDDYLISPRSNQDKKVNRFVKIQKHLQKFVNYKYNSMISINTQDYFKAQSNYNSISINKKYKSTINIHNSEFSFIIDTKFLIKDIYENNGLT